MQNERKHGKVGGGMSEERFALGSGFEHAPSQMWHRSQSCRGFSPVQSVMQRQQESDASTPSVPARPTPVS